MFLLFSWLGKKLLFFVTCMIIQFYFYIFVFVLLVTDYKIAHYIFKTTLNSQIPLYKTNLSTCTIYK